MQKSKNADEFILSTHPKEVRVKHIKRWCKQQDDEAKEELANFIYHRLTRRFIEPFSHISPPEFKSGFLMMASACLLIETLEQFYTGDDETPKQNKGESFKPFEHFFRREQRNLPGLLPEARSFYKFIRCGILHQAETKGGYRILRLDPEGPVLDSGNRTINANAFLRALEKSVGDYVGFLRNSEFGDERWKKAIKKLGHICDNCKR